MSRIGKLPVTIKEGVTVSYDGRVATALGPKGTLTFKVPPGIDVKIEDGKVLVSQKPVDTKSLLKTRKRDTQNISALFGLTRAMIANMITGVSSNFERKLELSGVGYRASVAGSDLQLSVGFSHIVKIKALPGISFAVSENTITVTGSDKSLVGDTASKIRAVRPPEPYKGKGILYQGERVRRKAGKAAKAVGAK